MNEVLNKIVLAVVAVVLILTVYNTFQISQLKGISEKKYIEPAPVTNTLQSSVSQPQTIPNNQISTPVNTTPLPQANSAPSGPTTSIQFMEEIHSFGTVEAESANPHSFQFINTGSEPLLISNATSSCGCTVPNWPKDPIMPGKTGIIDVIFTPKKTQAGTPVEKVVTVTANTNPSATMIRVKADVIAKQ